METLVPASSPPLTAAPQSADPRSYWLALAAAILLIKAVFLALDHAPMFFLGDSLAYLYTATVYYIPTDRSFTYGFLIRALSITTGSLFPLLAAQATASAGSAFLGGVIARRHFGASRSAAAIVAILCALEPLSLFYERYVMTEAFSLLAFAIYVTLALEYIQKPSAGRIIVVQLAAVPLISLRVSFLPLIESATILLPILAFAARRVTDASATIAEPPHAVRAPNFKRAAIALALSLASFFCFQYAYKYVYGALIQFELPSAPPAYYYDNGFHLIAFVAPIITPADFPNPALADAALTNLPYDLHNPRLRIHQRWLPGGLVERIKAARPDPLEANRLAEQTAYHAVLRDPIGELRLAAFGYGDYWRSDQRFYGMRADRGSDRPLPPELLALLQKQFHLDGESLPQLSTITNRYFFAAWPWYLAVLLSPLIGIAAIARSANRRASILLAVFLFLQIAVIAAVSIVPTVRFLHPVAWLTIVVCSAFFRTTPRANSPAQTE